MKGIDSIRIPKIIRKEPNRVIEVTLVPSRVTVKKVATNGSKADSIPVNAGDMYLTLPKKKV